MAQGVKVYKKNECLGWLTNLSVAKRNYNVSTDTNKAKRFKFAAGAQKACNMLSLIVGGLVTYTIEPLPKKIIRRE